MDALKIISEGSIKAEKPQFNVGDTVRVDVRIKDGDRERIQAFEGTVIAKKHGGVAETFTVRRVSYGVGVERVFPINSPFVEKVTVVRKGKVRRVAVLARLPRSRAIFDDPRVKREKRDNLLSLFSLFVGYCPANWIERCIGKWKNRRHSSQKLQKARAHLNGTRR